MRVLPILALLASLLAMPLAAQSPTDMNPVARVAKAPHAAPAPAALQAPVGTGQLTKADADSWLDGFVPYAIDQGDIAGAVIVVVKDGQVLTARGFGYADIAKKKRIDPDTTMFRPGSISKLFTWTSVMQLVQSGNLDLDRDINDYLDFKIPPYQGKPITLRNLMTHTPGFEETAKYLIGYDPKAQVPLDQVLKRWIPARIYAPGTMPAYSNYGASLAGYIVQRVSGEPFDDYVQHHIFDALGMRHSTFVQPLPAALLPVMASGYQQASMKPEGYELIDLAPAGSLAASGGDMARFMIAHLQNGGPLLSPQTAALMHAPANTPIPGLPPMALGFYHEDRNGQTIIGHAGDLNFFHSDLHLYMDKGVGLFMSFNSAGKDGAAHVVRERLFEQFTDRYFPDRSAPLPTSSTAHADGLLVSGHYVSSRSSQTNFLRMFGLLGGTTVTLNSDDTLSIAALTNAAGVPKHWRSVGHYLWQEVGGGDKLGAVVKNGKVVMLAPGAFAPIIEFVPAPASLNSGWIVPVLIVALVVMLLTALSWPIVALIRRSYAYDPALAGRGLTLHRATRITAWAMVAVAGGWTILVSILGNDTAAFDGRLDIWMRLLQLILIAAIVGTVLTVWNVYAVFTRPGKHRFASFWSVVVAVSALFLVWLALDLKLLTWSLNF
ncbi:serine hydrolase domain-containing protein [Sphingomonas oryzagri]